MDADTLIAVATVVIALATGVAAVAAAFAARATRRTTEAQIFSALMSEYASAEMGTALGQLRDAHRGWYRDPQGRQPEKLIEAWARRQVDVGAHGDLTDSARRLVAHFYWKATRIIDEGLVRGGLKEELRSLAGKDLMYDIVIPLETLLSQELGTVESTLNHIERFRAVFPDRRSHT